MDARSNDAARPPDEFAAHSKALRALARALIGRSADADDLVQDTWLAWLRSPPRDDASTRSWLVRVLSNRAMSARRSAGRREAREREVARPELVPAGLQLERDEALRRVVAAVLALEPAAKDVVWRRYFEDQGVERIATELRLSPRAVYERLEKAHSELRRSLERDFGDERRALQGLALLAGSRSEAALVSGGALASPAVWVAAAALLIGAVAWFASRPTPGSPALARAGEARGSARPQAVDAVGALDAARETHSVQRDEIESSDEVVETPPRWSPPGFEYELELRLVDLHGLPVAARSVLAAPAGRTLNFVGASDRNGAVLIRFRSFTPRVELDLATPSTELRERISLASGRTSLALRATSLGSRTHSEDGSLRHSVFSGVMSIGKAGRLLRLAESHRNDPIRALHEPKGWISFVEPWLMEPLDADSGATRGGLVVRGTLSEGLELVMGERAADQQGATLRGQVLDASGAAASNAGVHLRHESESLWRTLSLDERGEFNALELPAGHWELRASAAGLGAVIEEFELAPGEPRRRELRLESGRTFCARLIDVDGAACADWWIELLALDGARVAVDAALTGSDGRVRIANAPSGPLQVRARPAGANQRPALVVAHEAHANANELLLRAPLSAASTSADVELVVTPASAPGPVDLMARVRSLHSQQLAQLEFSGREDSLLSDSFRWHRFMAVLGGLLPGAYELEFQSPARGVVTLPPFELAVGAKRVIETSVAFASPASLRIEARPTRSGGARAVRLRKRDAQFELLSTPFDVSHEIELNLEPGEYELVTADALARWADVVLGAGETWVVFADGRVERGSTTR